MLEGFTISMSTFWILLFIIFLIAEAATAGLVSIWFCAGALCSFAAAKVGTAVYVQLIIFVIASVALLISGTTSAVIFFADLNTSTTIW